MQSVRENSTLMTMCCDLEALVGCKIPFYRAVVLEYGEGRALTGLVYCRTHNTHYRFVQLDNDDNVAAYGLYTIQGEHYDRLVELYSKGARPKWPLWITPSEQQLRHDTLQAILSVEETIWSHGKLDAVVAAENIIGTIILGTVAQPSISGEHVRRGTRWLSEVGL